MSVNADLNHPFSQSVTSHYVDWLELSSIEFFQCNLFLVISPHCKDIFLQHTNTFLQKYEPTCLFGVNS